MIAKNNPTSKINLLSLVEQARGLSEPLERGQASTPLTDAFGAMRDNQAHAPVSVSVLCLTAGARDAVAAWLQSGDCAGDQFTLQLSRVDELAASIGAYQRFCAQSHALVIVGPANLPLDADTLRRVCDLIEMFALVCPIVLTDPNDSRSSSSQSSTSQSSGSQTSGSQTLTCAPTNADDPAGPGGWWSQIAAQIAAQPTRAHLPPLTRSMVASDGADGNVLSSRIEPLRAPLLLERQASTFSGLVHKLAARIEHELMHLKGALSRLETPAKSSPARAAADSDKELAPLRERFAERVAGIDRQLTLKSDRSTQPLGELSGMMRSIATSLDVDDLEKTRSSAMIKLSVNASHLARINRRIEHVLRQEFISDLQQVEKQTQQAADEIADLLSQRFGACVPLKFPSLDVNQAWRSVENLMAIGKEANIEQVRKGFFDVLTAGRQKVFIIIMFASLMGRMGLPNLFTTPASKAGFGLFMGIVMVGSMINAVLHWRREKQLQSEKEMSKIRDTLLCEGNKVIEQVEKVKLAAMRDYCKEVFRSFEGTVKQFVEEIVTQQRVRRETEMQKQEALRKALEGRIKQVSDSERQLARLVEQTQGLWTAAIGAIHALATVDQSAAPVPTPSLPKQMATAIAPVKSPMASKGLQPGSESSRTRALGALAQRRERRSLAAKTSEA